MKATFAAGCFWHVQEEFSKIDGVTNTVAGYMGGDIENPSYEQVCSHKTGHAEVCQIEFNPEKVSYRELLEAFWKMHDPTQKNRQGADVGEQYRSAIFYHSERQKEQALESMKKEQEKRTKKIVTEILPAKEFYKAEEYHQHYLKKKGLRVC
ncbi:peptide-methionine (S)-S-oxide reductase MsrA [Candidatus Woesearchaeota archaeon]|nr:peptide-methionine (S)-S-oxide reductase MsrA [Candidatus Woesearchaeota archaeon]